MCISKLKQRVSSPRVYLRLGYYSSQLSTHSFTFHLLLLQHHVKTQHVTLCIKIHSHSLTAQFTRSCSQIFIYSFSLTLGLFDLNQTCRWTCMDCLRKTVPSTMMITSTRTCVRPAQSLALWRSSCPCFTLWASCVGCWGTDWCW